MAIWIFIYKKKTKNTHTEKRVLYFPNNTNKMQFYQD